MAFLKEKKQAAQTVSSKGECVVRDRGDAGPMTPKYHPVRHKPLDREGYRD